MLSTALYYFTVTHTRQSENDDVLYLQRDVDHFIAERSVRQKSLEAGLICKNEFDEWLETCEKRKYDIQRVSHCSLFFYN
jgi:hypothetical protein